MSVTTPIARKPAHTTEEMAKSLRELREKGGVTAAVDRINRITAALEEVDDSLPDGAWMQSLCDLTGLDAGQVAAGLRTIKRERRG